MPLIYIKWPKYLMGSRVRVFKNLEELGEHNQPLMSFLVTSPITPLGGIYADFIVPSNVAGVILLGDALDTTFDVFQLSWRRPTTESTCNSLVPTEYTLVGADKRIVFNQGEYSVGDNPEVYIETTRCKTSPDNAAWNWTVSCSARRTTPEQFNGVDNNEGTLLLDSVLEALNRV